MTKWLSDDRKNGPLPQADVEWGSNDWNQRMIDVGWKYWVMVVPTELHAADALSPVIADLYERGLRMRVFTNVESALEWLDSVD